MCTLNLRDNAFHLLRVNATTAIGEIASACEDARLDRRASEERLAQAQKSLTTPKLRLAEEVSSILENPDGGIDALLDAFEADEGAHLLQTIHLSDLSKANIAAHRCGHIKRSIEIQDVLNGIQDLKFLIEAQQGIKAENVLDAINNSRKIVGSIPLAKEIGVQEALKDLQEKHRCAALELVFSTKHPGKAMTPVTEKYRYDPGSRGAFVRELVRGYGKRIIPILQKFEKKMDTVIARVKCKPEDSAALATIIRQLESWDEYSQPAQLIDEAQGLDEARSRALFMKLRELALHLANSEERHEAALMLTTALLNTFPELPEASRLLAKDTSMLKKIIKDRKPLEKVEKLMDLAERIRETPDEFAQSLENGKKGGSGSKLRSLLKDIVKNQKLAKLEVVWLSVRSIAVELHNKHNLSHVALKLTQWLCKLAETHGAPSEIKAKLADDLRILEEQINRMKVETLLELIESIRKKPEEFARGFGKRGATGVGSRLRPMLEELVADPKLVELEIVWLSVRSLAVELHNKHNLTSCALELTKMLYALAKAHDAPSDIKMKLATDLRDLENQVNNVLDRLGCFDDRARAFGSAAAGRAPERAERHSKRAQSESSDDDSTLGILIGLGVVCLVIYYAFVR